MSQFKTVILALFVLGPWMAFANPGVVFVHGTGNPKADNDEYWYDDFVAKVTQIEVTKGGYIPSIAPLCNFDNYMWKQDAVGCVTSAMMAFIESENITRLYVITHSNGGNVLRWILSNPTYDPRYPKIIRRIKNVTAIAPSSLGTKLADDAIDGNFFKKAIGWAVGNRNNATRMQRRGSMQYLNREWLYGTSGRPKLPVPFRVIVGTNVSATSTWYCGDSWTDIALEGAQYFIEESCSDGVLSCSSQKAAGELWFEDTERADWNYHLSHDQSRRGCFGLDKILRDDVRKVLL